jgi:hypothetical protein
MMMMMMMMMMMVMMVMMMMMVTWNQILPYDAVFKYGGYRNNLDFLI